MIESWRLKKYYAPRVLIEIESLSNPIGNAGLVCISAAEKEVLLNLLRYARYRSTWVDEYRETVYVAPDNEQWDDVESFVAELEGKLMGCGDMLNAFERMADALECLCVSSTRSLEGVYTPATESVMQAYVDDGRAEWIDLYSGTNPLSSEQCAVAQLVYAYAWEMLTEVIQPGQRHALDVLFPAAMAALALMTGAPYLAVPAGSLGAVLAQVVGTWAESELTNVVNTLDAAKEDLVCAMYQGLVSGVRRDAIAAAHAVIDDTGLAFGDKTVLKALFANWVINQMERALDNDSEWTQVNVDTGYCAVCDEVVGTNWMALLDGTRLELDHIDAGSYWDYGLVTMNIPAAYTYAGTIARVESYAPGCALERLSAAGAGLLPPGHADLWDNDSIFDMENGQSYFFCANGVPFTPADVIERLAPGATLRQHNSVDAVAGPATGNGVFGLGYNCSGSTATVVSRWHVYYPTP